MKYVTDILVKEHDAILLSLDILNQMKLFVKNHQFDTQDINKMINFYKIFADECHHGKEEKILFPVIEKVCGKKELILMQDLINEHIESRKYIKEMERSISVSNNIVNFELFIKNADNYINLIQRHIKKENDILFPESNENISEIEHKNLIKRFNDFEIEVIGKTTHKKLHDMLNYFEKKYLAK